MISKGRRLLRAHVAVDQICSAFISESSGPTLSLCFRMCSRCCCCVSCSVVTQLALWWVSSKIKKSRSPRWRVFLLFRHVSYVHSYYRSCVRVSTNTRIILCRKHWGLHQPSSILPCLLLPTWNCYRCLYCVYTAVVGMCDGWSALCIEHAWESIV